MQREREDAEADDSFHDVQEASEEEETGSDEEDGDEEESSDDE